MCGHHLPHPQLLGPRVKAPGKRRTALRHHVAGARNKRLWDLSWDSSEWTGLPVWEGLIPRQGVTADNLCMFDALGLCSRSLPFYYFILKNVGFVKTQLDFIPSVDNSVWLQWGLQNCIFLIGKKRNAYQICHLSHFFLIFCDQ